MALFAQGLPSDHLTAFDGTPTAVKPEKGRLMVKVKRGYLRSVSALRGNSDFLKITDELKIKELEQPFAPFINRQKLSPEKKILADLLNIEGYVELSYDADISLEAAMSKFRKFEWVENVEPIYPHFALTPPLIPTDTDLAAQWDLGLIQAYDAWGLHTGDSTVVVGVVDTGINYNHPDMKNQMHYNAAERSGISGFDDDANGFVDDSLGYDFGAMDNNPIDEHYHGSAVAGRVAARTNNGLGIASIGFRCKIMPIKVFTAAYAVRRMFSGILYAAENGCKVINLSLGRPDTYLQWEQDIITYVSTVKDVLVVAAGGNANYYLDYYPASYNYVLSVAHSRSTDERWVNGTWSHFIDVMAPGVGVYTTFNPTFVLAPGISYYNVTGSSFASPQTAGLAALVRSAYPTLTGQQAGELIRVTSDDKYALPANAAYLEMIGKGRINAYRALTELPTSKSIRMTNFALDGKYGNFGFPGDTATVTCDFTNYLQALSSAHRIKLRAVTPYVTVLDSVFVAGAMPTLGTKSNQGLPFKIRIDPSVPTNYELKFRLEFKDGPYTDWQYFIVNVNKPYLHVDFNDIDLTLTNIGRLAHYSENGSDGLGGNYLGASVLSDGGLLIGHNNGSIKVSDCILDTMSLGSKAMDFRALDNPIFDSLTPFYTGVVTTMTDTIANPSKIGLKVKQRIWGKTNTPYSNAVIVEYDVTNLTATTMDSLNVALYADWDLGVANDNFADWHAAKQFGYAFESGGKFAGIKALDGANSYFALDMTDVGGGNINVTDQFTTAEKFQAIGNGISRTQAGYSVAGNDVSHFVGTKISNLLPGQTRKVRFLMMVANNLAGLVSTVDAVETLLNPASVVSPKPSVSAFVCNTAPRTVTPTGGTTFRFYKAPNTKTPVATGSSMVLAVADTSSTFYVTCVDPTVEGDYKEVKFKLHTPTAAITAIDSINLLVTSTVNFTDASAGAVSWSWDFDDGSPVSLLQNPSHTYLDTGHYTVRLIMTDFRGCVDTAYHALKAVNSGSPVPNLPPFIEVCGNDPLVLAPTNGTFFNFYKTWPSTTPFFSGVSLKVTSDMMLTEVWVTNNSLGAESAPIRVKIKRYAIYADFETNPRADTVLYYMAQFLNRSTSDLAITKHTWDMGDGTIKVIESPFHIYAAQGVYKVKLTIENIKGCKHTIIKEFRVGKKAATPIHKNINTCTGDVVTIAPKNGKMFRFYEEKPFELGVLPIRTGNSYSFAASSKSPKIIYITNIDSLVESEYLALTVTVNEPRIDFDFDRELFLSDKNTVMFRDMSTRPKSWLWNFGDGTTSTEKNPSHVYSAQGIYPIILTMTDLNGCTATLTKTLKVISRSPTPLVADKNICRGDSTTIIPMGGTRFRFFDSRTSSTPIFEGRAYNTGFLKSPKTYYVTCRDSMVESEYAEVRIGFRKPTSNFTISADTLNIYSRDTLVVDAEGSSSAAGYQWFFGNGKRAATKRASVIFDSVGVFTIKLVTQDIAGCTDTLIKSVVVINEPTLTGVEETEDYSLLIYPNPTSDIVAIDFRLKQQATVDIQLFNSAGVRVHTVPSEVVKDKKFRLSLSGLGKGLYQLRIRYGDKIILRKVGYL